jgi:hypothetical protein
MCSIDSSKCLARDTGSEDGEFDPFSGFGKIITENVLSPFPVELSSFTANLIGSDVILDWRTETEIDNYGFEVEKHVGSRQRAVGEWITLGFVDGHGNSNSPKEYSFIDKSPKGGKQISYRLKQIDNDGDFEYSKIITVEIDAPNGFELSQNYPNPFNPTTNIQYAISSRQFVTLKLYDVLGNEVIILVAEEKEPGRYDVGFNAARLSSGAYIYRLEAGNYTATKQMILLK